MIFWVDGQLSPQIVKWLAAHSGCRAAHIEQLNLLNATDHAIFEAARALTDVVLVTKDSDFCEIVRQRGAPPQVLWLKFGNASNARTREIVERQFAAILIQLRNGEPIVEVA